MRNGHKSIFEGVMCSIRTGCLRKINFRNFLDKRDAKIDCHLRKNTKFDRGSQPRKTTEAKTH